MWECAYFSAAKDRLRKTTPRTGLNKRPFVYSFSKHTLSFICPNGSKIYHPALIAVDLQGYVMTFSSHKRAFRPVITVSFFEIFLTTDMIKSAILSLKERAGSSYVSWITS